MAALILTGTPQQVDSFYRPVARALQLAFSGLMALALVWFGAWWWAPMPFVVSLVAYEGFFWWRGDRVQRLRLENGRLLLSDPLAPADLVVSLEEVTVATLYYRQHSLDQIETTLVLGDDDDVRFAVRILQRSAFVPQPHDVPAEVHDVLFGGIAGLYRALAPASMRPRQTFEDSDGALIAQLRRVLPAVAWRRTGIRLWQGMEPTIDLFGYYDGPHTAWLVLDGHAWKRGLVQGSISGWSFGASVRSAVLFWGLADRKEPERLPLALVNLGASTTVAIPAPLGDAIAEGEPLTSDLFHTHAPEGAALLWHLMVHTPRDRWPRSLGEMIADRRGIRPDLDTALPG